MLINPYTMANRNCVMVSDFISPEFKQTFDHYFTIMERLIQFYSKRTLYPAIVAGGCVRDLLLNEEPKDIDVFVFKEDLELLEPYSDYFSQKEENGNYQSANFKRICYYDVKYKGKEIKVDICYGVGVRPEDVMRHFDLDVCMFGMRSDGALITCKDSATIENLRNRKAKVINFKNMKYHHYKRMRQRFQIEGG